MRNDFPIGIPETLSTYSITFKECLHTSGLANNQMAHSEERCEVTLQDAGPRRTESVQLLIEKMEFMGQQQVFLIRHGETEWSRAGRHTGRTDVPLTDEGERRAEAIGRTLRDRDVSVWTSPLRRARETCRLVGFADLSRVDDDLREWDYGVYEGRTTLEIRQETPEWSVWLSPIVNGESLDQVADRAGRVIARAIAAGGGDVVLFSHGHMLRILAACWIGIPPVTGRFLALDTASISVLGYERQTRVIRKWNVTPPE